MARDEDKLSQRLMARQGGLTRRVMPDGRHALSGPTATKALKTLGARAFTMDREIFVPERFDPSGNPEDLALYTHEAHHREESGGSDDGHEHNDSEELAARARERLVLQRSRRGEGAGDIMRDLDSSAPSNLKEADQMLDGDVASMDAANRPNPTEAYKRLRRSGMSHDRIVENLAEDVVRSMKRQKESVQNRTMENG